MMALTIAVVPVQPDLVQSKVKKELKAWQKEFEAKVGRPATDADKSAIEDRFLYHQKVLVGVALRTVSVIISQLIPLY